MKKISSLSLLFLLTGCLTQNPIIELAPSAPTSLTVSPVSPSNDTTPTIRGVTSSDVSVVLYAAPGCMGSAMAAGQAGNSGQFSLTSGELPTGLYNFSVRASNARGSICSSETVAYNLTATPPVASVSKDPASPALIRSTDTVNFIVEYTDAEEVNLTSTDILISDTGTVACADITVTDGTTSTPHVTIGNCTGDGTFGIAVAAGTATNLAGSSLASNMSSTVTVDNTGISTATFDPPAGTYNTMPSSLEITFPEAFSGLGVGDFAINGTCSIKPNITLLETTSTTGTITLSAPVCAAGETVEITLDFAGIEDGAGNVGTGQLVTTYTIDAVGPTSATFNPGTGSINAIPATIDVTFSEDINPSSLFGTSFSVTGTCGTLPTVGLGPVSGDTAQITLSGGACTNTQNFDISIDLSTVEDSMGSAGSGTANATYTFDDVGPLVTSITPATGTVGAAPTSVTVNFGEEVHLASVDGTDVAITGTCGAGVTASLTSVASGTSMSFDLLGVACTHGQTLIVTFDGTSITDAAGNAGTGSESVTYTVDTSGPTILSVSPATSTVGSIPASVTFTFSEDVEPATINVVDDFTLAGSCSTPPTKTLGTITGPDVTVNLSGASCLHNETVILTAESSGITDMFGNVGVGSEVVTYTLDSVKPVAGAFTPGSQLGIPATVSVSFDEDIKASSVDVGDFVVTAPLCTGVVISNISVTGATITFDLAATCASNDTVDISINGAAVTDLADNAGSGSATVTYTKP